MNMRLDASTFGFLTCLVGLAAGKNSRDVRGSEVGTAGVTGTSTSSSSSNSVVVIEPAFPTPATFAQSEGNQTITFQKGAGITDLTVTYANLKTYTDSITIGRGVIPQPLSTGTTGQDDTNGENLDVERRQQLPPLRLPTTEDSVILPLEDDVDTFGRWINQPLYIEFVWSNSTSSGTSSTPVFAIYTTEYDTAASNLQDTDTGSNPARPESITPSSGTTDGSPSATSTSEAAQTNSSGGNQGLSPGAIAGIAVGCAVAVILIIALIAWFFCFRRRSGHRSGQRSRDPNVSYASDSVTQHVMIGDKEIPGISESTPHSTYGGEDGVAGSGVGGVVGGPFGRPSMSTEPYIDRAPTPTLTPPPPAAAAAVAAASVSGHRPSHSQSEISITRANTNTNATREAGAGVGAGARSSTPPVASRYAHLVEEGMTEAEIRRLEEEERHLDEAIEDAGRHRRTCSR
ncbi:hypothetical protein F5X99DRAFT_20604 [Biscogniauxia marginata]|nr:hypothetical protein F5X99DRAFT_20604 [Biscogniauxia marginata]